MATFDLLGIYVPDLLAKVVLAVVLSLLLVRLFTFAGLYRGIWHPALFNVSLFIVLLGLLALPGTLWWWLQ